MLKALADMQYRREKTVSCSRPLQICSTGGRRRWLIRPNPVGWKFLGAFLKYILDTDSSEDGSCLKMVEKEILCFRDGLLAKLGLSLLVELLSDLLQVLFAQVSPSPGKGDTKKKIIWFAIKKQKKM